MSNVKMSDVIMSAVELVLSRGGDEMTEDGDFATCGTDEIIRLDMAIAEFLGLPSDDVDIRDIDLILAKAKDYDGNQELIANMKGRVNLQNVEIEKLVERLQHSEDLNTKQQSHIDTLANSALHVHENKPEFHSEGMGCGLEDRNIHCRYEAMEYGWEKAIGKMYADVIAPIDEALAATNQDKE